MKHKTINNKVKISLRVKREVIQTGMRVEREHLPQLEEFLQGLINENEADESCKGFLCESRYIAHQRAGVCGNQHDTQEGRPQANASAQREVGETVVTEKRQTYYTSLSESKHHKHILCVSYNQPCVFVSSRDNRTFETKQLCIFIVCIATQKHIDLNGFR